MPNNFKSTPKQKIMKATIKKKTNDNENIQINDVKFNWVQPWYHLL